MNGAEAPFFVGGDFDLRKLLYLKRSRMKLRLFKITSMAKIKVENKEITILADDFQDYISLTDMANAKESESRAADIIKNWIRTRFTLEFIGTWEKINNPDFKVVEFDHFKTQAGLPSFVLSVSEWIEKTNAISLCA